MFLSKMEHSSSNPLSRMPIWLKPIMSSTSSIAVVPLMSGQTALPLPMLPMAPLSILSSLDVSTPRKAPRSNTVVLRLQLRYPKVIGCGPRSGCCRSTVFMDHGQNRERLISVNREATTTHMHREETISCRVLCIGGPTPRTMLGGGPM